MPLADRQFTFAGAVWDPYGTRSYIETPNLWHIPQTSQSNHDPHPFLTQDPPYIEPAVVFDPDGGYDTDGKGGWLVTGPFFGWNQIITSHSVGNPVNTDNQHILHQRVDASWDAISGAIWELQEATIPQAVGRHVAFEQGARVTTSWPDDGPTSLLDVRLYGYRTGSDYSIHAVEFTDTPSSVALLSQLHPGGQALTLGANLAAVEAGNGSLYWFGSGYLYFKITGLVNEGQIFTGLSVYLCPMRFVAQV